MRYTQILIIICLNLPLLSSAQVLEEELTPNERRAMRGLSDVSNIFVPKGQWIFGGTGSYSTHTNESYDFLVIEGIESNGHTYKISPFLVYAIRDNMALGGRFAYSSTPLEIDAAYISIGEEDSEVNIGVNSYSAIKHSYSAAAVWRQYIPLGRNKRFALFNEVQLSLGGGESKFTFDTPVKGTFERTITASLGVSPGIVAFATNNVAIELNVGVMGVSYSTSKQIHNQIIEGKSDFSMMSFKINIFAIGLSVSFYV